MKNLFDIKDQVVVITGGTGVLGKAIAAHLAEEGAKVVILGRKAEVGNAIVEDIKAKGGEAMFLTTNVLDEAVLEQNLKDVLAAYGKVDALLVLFNAGAFCNVCKIAVLIDTTNATGYMAVFSNGFAQFVAYHTEISVISIGKTA